MAVTSCTVRFSNVGGGTGSLPKHKDSIDVSGLKENSVVFVKVNDIRDYLGCTLTGGGNAIVIQRNGQIVELTVGSTAMETNIGYFVKNYQTSAMVSYSFQWQSVLPVAPFVHTDGYKYVPAEMVAMQLGALIVGTWDSVYTIYDFAVKESEPRTDTNTYIVGGTWITNWSTIASTYIAPHFKISEVYSKNSSYSGYRQLKIAVSLLDSLEAVRHYYRADKSLTVSCAFRSWGYNKGLSGSWDRSFHMRGRAYDIASANNGTELYNAVYEEFCGTSTTPISMAGFWRTRVSGSSKGYEIETMPRNGVTWLHLQVEPGYNSSEEKRNEYEEKKT